MNRGIGRLSASIRRSPDATTTHHSSVWSLIWQLGAVQVTRHDGVRNFVLRSSLLDSVASTRSQGEQVTSYWVITWPEHDASFTPTWARSLRFHIAQLWLITANYPSDILTCRLSSALYTSPAKCCHVNAVSLHERMPNLYICVFTE